MSVQTNSIDIDSLLGTVSRTAEQAPNPAPAVEMATLLRRLSSWSDATSLCRDVPIDLRLVNFVSDDGGMWLTLPGDDPLRRIDFKRDPANPKDPKIIHAQKQFCRMLGVPHGFFMSNRPSMRESLVRTWQSGLETDDKRAKCVARVRQGGSVTMLRALLPERAVPPRAFDIVATIRESFGSAVNVLFSHGDDRDDLVLHARFVFGDRVPVDGIDLHMGFDLVFSELGACPMTVDAIVHDPLHVTTYVASYGGEPFFGSKYEGLQPKELSDMFPGLLERIRAEAPDMAGAVRSASEGIYSIKQDCVSIVRSRGLTAAMRKAVFHEATQATDIVTKMDLARHVSLVSKDFDSLKGLALERAAGHYINLCFPRSLPEAHEEKSNEEAAQVRLENSAAAC